MAQSVSTREFLEAARQYASLFMTVSVYDGQNVRSTGYAPANPQELINMMNGTIVEPQSRQVFNLDQHSIVKFIEDQQYGCIGFGVRSADQPMELSLMFKR